jgi:signal transduction histidine kinase
MPGRVHGTIRWRITALAAAVVTLVLTATAVALVTMQRAQLTASVDSTLQQRADDIVVLLETSDRQPSRLSEGYLDGFAQLVSVDGKVLAASQNVAGHTALPDGLDAGQSQTIRTVDHTPVDDDPFRLLSRRLDLPAGPAVLLVGASLDEIAEGTSVLATSLAVAIPVVVALLTLLVWWLAGRFLAPVESIRSEVAAIGGTDLDRRVPEPVRDDEVRRLARTMNGMLDRLEESLSRQQQFVADASHELRSPLTRIRTELEVDLASTDLADPRTTHHSVLEEIIDLQHLVDDLLQLARVDATVSGGRTERVDLDDLVFREARRLGAAGRVELDTTGVSAAEVMGDPEQLTRAVRNLVDNAQRHATERVELTLAEHDGVVRLTVSNDGPGIPPGQYERIFERFARLDDARSRKTGGTGLGLAITREIIERHGGTIIVESRGQAGAHFVVRMPSSPAHSP